MKNTIVGWGSATKDQIGHMVQQRLNLATVPQPADAADAAADDKIVSDLTPSARGVGSRLRHLSREAIIGMYHRNGHPGHNGQYDEEGCDGEYYSCGGGIGDDTFSSHASPACARIGRMLSAPYQPQSAPERTPTAPF